MLLSLATFLAMAASCAPQIAPETLAKGAKVESGFETLALNDNTLKREFHPRDKAEAIEMAQRLRNAGHNLDLGIMQNNIGNFDWLGLTIEDAFEPCSSISAGARELIYWSRYNTGSPKRGFENGYVAKIIRAGSEIKASPDKAGAAGAQVVQASPVPAHNWDVFPDDDDKDNPAITPIDPKEMANPESADAVKSPAGQEIADVTVAQPQEHLPEQDGPEPYAVHINRDAANPPGMAPEKTQQLAEKP